MNNHSRWKILTIFLFVVVLIQLGIFLYDFNEVQKDQLKRQAYYQGLNDGAVYTIEYMFEQSKNCKPIVFDTNNQTRGFISIECLIGGNK